MTSEQCPSCGAHRGLDAHSKATDEPICNRCYNNELLQLLMTSQALPLAVH